MKSKVKKILYIIVTISMAMLPVLASCGMGDQPSGIKNGYARDYLSNVEQEGNGLWQVWLRSDPTTVYCTGDNSTGLFAQSILTDTTYTSEAVIQYRDLKDSDPEQSGIFNIKCGQGFSVTVLPFREKILNITPVGGRTGR